MGAPQASKKKGRTKQDSYLGKKEARAQKKYLPKGYSCEAYLDFQQFTQEHNI